MLSDASDQLEPSASARDIKASTEDARLMGCRVYHVPRTSTAAATLRTPCHISRRGITCSHHHHLCFDITELVINVSQESLTPGITRAPIQDS